MAAAFSFRPAPPSLQACGRPRRAADRPLLVVLRLVFFVFLSGARGPRSWGGEASAAEDGAAEEGGSCSGGLRGAEAEAEAEGVAPGSEPAPARATAGPPLTTRITGVPDATAVPTTVPSGSGLGSSLVPATSQPASSRAAASPREPTTGKRVAARQSHWFRVVNGKITEHWAVRDDLGMMWQLGVMPP